MSSDKLFEQLTFYTLSHPDKDYFIHQLSIDAYTAQTATEDTQQISLVFALVGLYLFAEKNFTGKQIQKAHLLLAKYKDDLPEVILPEKRGNLTIKDVLTSTENIDDMIKQWCVSVWKAYEVNRKKIKQFCDKYLFKFSV